ncbi:MAG: hypothetical protein VCF08_18875 [Alphaproteobacteria bacterium]
MAYTLPDKPSIAVLPFDNLSGDPAQDYLGDGITENIIAVLATSPDLFVIARNSSFTYKGKAVQVQEAAERFGVRYVLEGSVQRAGDWLRVTAQLVNAIDGQHLWAERYDRELDNLFALQDEIAQEIFVAMDVKLTIGGDANLFLETNQGSRNLPPGGPMAQPYPVLQSRGTLGSGTAVLGGVATAARRRRSEFGHGLAVLA